MAVLRKAFNILEYRHNGSVILPVFFSCKNQDVKKAENKSSADDIEVNEMKTEYVELNTGAMMPMEGIGTFLLQPDEAQNACLAALKDGYRLIDTANAYVNEKAVGRAVKESGIDRNEIFIETKLWPSFYEDENAVDKTLDRLQVESIDLMLLHQPAGNWKSGWKLLEKGVKEGKIKAIGISNFKKEQVEELLGFAQIKPCVLQMEIHPYNQETEFKQYLGEKGIIAQAWYPLGHGDRALIEEPVFTRLAQKYGKNNVQIILRWHVQDGNIVIPGSKNPDHIRSNFDIWDFELTDEEMKEIAALNQNKHYYTSTPELLAKYALMVPDVDGQK